MESQLAPVARNLVTHASIFGIGDAAISKFLGEGIVFGGATVKAEENPQLWTTAVLGDHYQEVGLNQGRALQIADEHVVVLKAMDYALFGVEGNPYRGFTVGYRKFNSPLAAHRHLEQLHAVMALDALTGGLYFGASSERGVTEYTDYQRDVFFQRGAAVVYRYLDGKGQLSEFQDRLKFEKWFWDLGGKKHDPLEAVLRNGNNESPLFWGIMFRARFIDRGTVERVNPRLKEMLGITPRTY